MKAFLDSVRKAAHPGTWSQGAKLNRDRAVTIVSRSDREWVLRVRAPGVIIPPTVSLGLEDKEWSCDCSSKLDPCIHVIASAIAAAADVVGTAKLNAAKPDLQLEVIYRLSVRKQSVAIARFFRKADGHEEPIHESLTARIAKVKVIPGFNPSADEMRVDRILGIPPRDVIPSDRIRDVLGAISGSPVYWNDKPIETSAELVHPRARVADGDAGGFRLIMERDPKVDEIVARGVVRCGNTFYPAGDTLATGDLLEKLPVERKYAAKETPDLVGQILPELEKRLTVTVETKKLPRIAPKARPRVQMDFSHHGHTLSVLPTLVYGKPSIAHVINDELVLLGKHTPIRRKEDERKVLSELRDVLNLVPGRRVDLDGTDALRFAAKVRAFQAREDAEAGETGISIAKAELRALVKFDDGVFDVEFDLEEDDYPEDPELLAAEGGEGAVDRLPSSGPPGSTGPKGPRNRRRADAATVLRAFRDGLELVPLNDGTWAPLPTGWLSRYGNQISALLAAREADKTLPKAALIELGALSKELSLPKPRELERLSPLLEGFEGIPAVPLPDGVFADLRSYQKQGFDWLSFLRDAALGGVLADDMGLGKTLQTICALKGRTLVVCPKSVVYNWAEEIRKFRPALTTATYHGPRRELDPKADVTLTTYAVLRIDATVLGKEAWDIVVLDEAQAIKNSQSQSARAAFGLRGEFRLALSGTPVENRLEELWSIMRFTNPGLLGGRGDFDENYVSPIASGDASAAARLRAKLRPFLLRRKKSEVLPELPPRTDTILHVELDETERAIYEAVRIATRKEVAEKLSEGGGVLAALEALLRLRQASCHAALVPGQVAESSSKVDRLVEALEEASANGHKALVFSQWTSLLDKVEPHLKRAGLAFTRLDGSTRDRARVVSEFQADDGPPVMLISLKAGGTGLNLTAADHVFLMDPWWNPAVEDQAADRAHRIGQERPVMVYRMVAKDTVEERIFSLQAQKRALADVALEGAGGAAGITRDDLLALLA
jgi:superfamily II DNA or RNA helicase